MYLQCIYFDSDENQFFSWQLNLHLKKNFNVTESLALDLHTLTRTDQRLTNKYISKLLIIY
jgi:hypothetical protein